MALGDSQTTDFWTEFLRSLRDRGLKVAPPPPTRSSRRSGPDPIRIDAPRAPPCYCTPPATTGVTPRHGTCPVHLRMASLSLLCVW